MSDTRTPYTVAEAADLLRMNPRTLRHWIAEGTFPVPVIRMGSLIRIPRRPLDSLLDGGVK